MNKFFYIDTELKEIEDKKFFCIYLLHIQKKIIFKTYKLYDNKLAENIKNLKLFQDVTDKTYFVIKRDGKISIDINL